MKRRRCTSRIAHGRSKTKAHGVTGDCIRVRVYNEAGELLRGHWVCAACRRRMRLPDHDVEFRPGTLEVSGVIVDPEGDALDALATAVGDTPVEGLATGGPVDPGRWVVVGNSGPDEFRLP